MKPDPDATSTMARNLQKKRLPCLACGKVIVTDRCHRFCRVCQRRNLRNGYHLPVRAKAHGEARRATADVL